MKIYILSCNYDKVYGGPEISKDYQELYRKMKEDYFGTLKRSIQTETEKELCRLGKYSATVVSEGIYHEWFITWIEIPYGYHTLDMPGHKELPLKPGRKGSSVTLSYEPRQAFYSCPYCGALYKYIDYCDFATNRSSSHHLTDWVGETIICPSCGEEFEIRAFQVLLDDIV